MNDFPRDFPFIFVFGERLSHTKFQLSRFPAINSAAKPTRTFQRHLTSPKSRIWYAASLHHIRTTVFVIPVVWH